jgi:hypothetical protein
MNLNYSQSGYRNQFLQLHREETMFKNMNIFGKLSLLLLFSTICLCPGIGMVISLSMGDQSMNTTGPFIILVVLGFVGTFILATLGAIKKRNDLMTGSIPTEPFEEQRKKALRTLYFFIFITGVAFVAAVIPWEPNMQRIGWIVSAGGAIGVVVQIIRVISLAVRVKS